MLLLPGSSISPLGGQIAGCARLISVLSWGRNTEQQCGIEGNQPVVTQPTAVLELLQQPVTSIAAGRNNSAAVVRNSDVYTWGEGLCGKLGLGSGAASAPSRVEAFVGRCAIQAVSLGHHHSLFLDAGGQLWAAGENNEGQCGLGTPLADLARMHRQAYDEAMWRIGAYLHQPNPSDKYKWHLQASAAAAAAAAAAGPEIAHGWGTLQPSRPHSSSQWGSRMAEAVSQQSSSSRRAKWLPSAWEQQGSSSSMSGMQPSFNSSGTSISGLDSMDARARMRALQMQPGQAHTPIRVGCEDVSAMLLQQQLQQQQEGQDASGSSSSSVSSCSSSLSEEVVVSMAASKYFSAAVTAKGELWTFGACYNGALGSQGASWQTSAARVSKPISDAIAARGGATAVAAGSTFTAVLTAAGKVLLLGKLYTNSNSSRASSTRNISLTPPADATAASSSSDAVAAGTEGWCEVALPDTVHIKHIAAGQQHLVLSDGEQVWAVGRWMDQAGAEAGCAPAEAPQQLLALPSAGIVRLAAGMHSSACVDGDGQLWMWGRLLDQAQAQAAVQAGLVLPVGGGGSGTAGLMQLAEAARRVGQVDWDWAGFGAAGPRKVEGLQGVQSVALGGWHALVLAD